jgi:hypothetical protein
MTEKETAKYTRWAGFIGRIYFPVAISVPEACKCANDVQNILRAELSPLLSPIPKPLKLAYGTDADICLQSSVMTALKFVVINNGPIVHKPTTNAGHAGTRRAAAPEPDYPRAQYKMQARTYMNKHADIFAFCPCFKATRERIIYCPWASLLQDTLPRKHSLL